MTYNLHLEGEEGYPFSMFTCNGAVAIHGPGSIVWTEADSEGYGRDAHFYNGVTVVSFPPNQTLSEISVYGTPSQIESTLQSIHEAYKLVSDECFSPFNNLNIMRMDEGRVTMCTVVHHEFSGEITDSTIRLPPFQEKELLGLTAVGSIHPEAYTFLHGIGVEKVHFNTQDYY